MIYEIKKYGEECLVKESVPVSEITDEILEILDNMVETMHDANGVGLAAPQVGINKRFFVIDIGDGVVRKIINPEILEFSESISESDEGCLSVPGIYKKVKRAYEIKVKYMNELGEVKEETMNGFLAKAFQHEFDHLTGTLFIEKISPMAKRLIAQKLKHIKRETEREHKNKENA
ncbi:peptide deformylase [Fusobacterium sp.]|uniref:peptide deformylase n=1 Tax=Fusobacterium sp. TaxID=68766 RepID=UPI0026196020|nr:peptide deformylase [Fusobacterium sp.]